MTDRQESEVGDLSNLASTTAFSLAWEEDPPLSLCNKIFDKAMRPCLTDRNKAMQRYACTIRARRASEAAWKRPIASAEILTRCYVLQ